MLIIGALKKKIFLRKMAALQLIQVKTGFQRAPNRCTQLRRFDLEQKNKEFLFST